MNIVILLSIILVICWLSNKFDMGGAKPQLSTFFSRDYTTTAKGVAILLIMIGHVSGSWAGGRILTPCGGIGVAIFLITSGYGLNESYKKRGLSGFWKKRLCRVYIPYLLVAILYAIVNQWDFQKCLLNFTCVNSPYWFVTYIIECYVAFWFFSKYLTKYRIETLSIVALSTVFLLPELQAEQALSFVSGIILSEYNRISERLEQKQYYSRVCIMAAIIGFSFLAFKQLPLVRAEATNLGMNIIQILIKFPLAVSILLIIYYFQHIFINPFIYLAGKISYELYLVHFPFYTLICGRLWPALLLLVVSFVVAYPFYKMNNLILKKIVS